MKKVYEYIKQYNMIQKGDRVIAGISGGADSVCLFLVLLELREQIGFELTAVHVNHGLRGADADADEAFAASLCAEHGIPIEIFRVDLELIAGKRKQSLEEAGREVRREAFLQVMEQYNGNRIALAHHQNDNAETLLWNLSRGTGVTGLGGIRPVNGVWIRPLLCLDRLEIEAYLAARGQAYCTDQTNLDTEYTRNRLRHQVIPELERVNSAAVRHMNEAMEQLRELREFAEEKTGEAMAACVRGCDGGGQKILEKEWRSLPPFLQKEVIYGCLAHLCGSRKDLGKVHVDAVRELFEKQVGRSRNLPGGILAVREYDGVRLGRDAGGDHSESESGGAGQNRRRAERTEAQEFAPVEIQIPGETAVPEAGLVVTCRILEKKDGFKVEDIPQKVYTKWFDYDIIKKTLHIRTRQSGDSITIDRDGHRQKLKSWFVNEKIPARERESVPLIAEGQQVVWIIGYRMSGAYQISGRTKRILQIEIVPTGQTDSLHSREREQ